MSERNTLEAKRARRKARGERPETKGAADQIGSSGNVTRIGSARLNKMSQEKSTYRPPPIRHPLSEASKARMLRDGLKRLGR